MRCASTLPLLATLLAMLPREGTAVENAGAQQTPVGAALDADDIEREYDLCGSGGWSNPTVSLSDFDGSRNGGSYTVIAVATFFTGCSPGRFVAPVFAQFCAEQKLLHGDAFQCITSLKGSSSCSSWSRRYHDVDGDTSNDDANIPLVVTDTTSALHYTLFDGNPQFAIIDKNMVVRQLVVGTSATTATVVEGLAGFVAPLIAEEVAPAPAPAPPPAGPVGVVNPPPLAAGQTIEVGGDAGWVVMPGNAVYEPITANIGDILLFGYNQYYHDVMLVDNEDCDFSAGTMLDETGHLEYEITAAGTYTFVCTRGDHCSGGNQQITVTVEDPEQVAGAQPQSCAPAFGLQNSVVVEFTNDEGLNNPRDLQFHPLNPNELWVANNDTDSITIIDTVAGTAATRRDRAPYHYMERISSLAFDSRGYFATCQESENSYDGMMIPNWFMGPTLFHSEPTELINQLGEPGCDTTDPDRTCFFTHWDMLHESPLCMGITHDPETETPFGNVYWAFDGLNSSLIRFDFQEPHGPGSLDHSIAAIRRYPEIELTRVPGVPGHLMMDPTERVLYIADTGGGRILRMDPDSGHFIRTAKREFPIYSSTAETFEYSIYGCSDWEVFADGLDEPSGLHISEGFIYVTEHGNGKITAFDRVTGEQVDQYQTDAEKLLGIEVDGEGNIWFVDGARNEVSKLVVDQECEDGSVTDHNLDVRIGGYDGWRVQDYEEVSAVVGQRLVFDFEEFHDVIMMADEAAFDACDFSSAIRLADVVDSPFTLLLQEADTLYFSDSTGMHCQAGQKVKVTVTEVRMVWADRECTMVVDNDLTVDVHAHSAGYMNLTGFLGISDYADAEVHHCGGNSVTLSAAMAGMPTADESGNYRMNNDALLMEGYMCHVCLPAPCANGGVCSHIPWGFTCDCSGTGFGGDTCERPGEDPACFLMGDINADLVVDVNDILLILSRYGRFTDPGDPEDLNGDGRVAVDDLLMILSQFGASCDAAGTPQLVQPVNSGR